MQGCVLQRSQLIGDHLVPGIIRMKTVDSDQTERAGISLCHRRR